MRQNAAPTTMHKWAVALGMMSVLGCASAAPEAGTDVRLPAWGDSLVATFQHDPPRWLLGLTEGRLASEVHLLAWHRHESVCQDEVTQALLWLELTGVGGARWALLYLMRSPFDGSRWPREGVRRWFRSYSPYNDYPTWTLLERPPTNDDIARLWGPFEFGHGGWPVLDGAVYVDTWRDVIGDEPPYSEVRLSARSAGPCAPVPGGGQWPAEPRNEPQAGHIFSWTTDSVAAIYDLLPLDQLTLPPGYREVRIWTGFGITIPHTFVRIIDGPRGTDGMMVWWWDAVPDDPRMMMDEISVEAGNDCVLDPRPNVVTCDVRVPNSEWEAAVDSLAALGLFDLPEQPVEPGYAMTDGFSVVVEALDGSAYQAVVDPWDGVLGAERARRIVQILHDVYSKGIRPASE